MEIRLTADFLTDITIVLNFVMAVINLLYLRRTQKVQIAKLDDIVPPIV